MEQGSVGRDERKSFVEPPRGNILDVRGRELAVDVPCIDVCVDYRAIQDPPDEDWVKGRALERLKGPWGEGYGKASRAAAEDARRRGGIGEGRCPLDVGAAGEGVGPHAGGDR